MSSWADLLARLETIIERCSPAAVGMNDDHKGNLLELLQSYNSNEIDFRQYVHYDNSGYTKNLVKRIGEECNVIVMCWAPGQSSVFHAHESSKCFVKVLAGELIEQQVAYPQSQDKINIAANRTTKLLSMNDVSYIDDSVGLHQVRNSSTREPAITLHIYTPPYTKCRVFIEDDQHCLSKQNSESLDVTFYTELGSKVA